MNFHDRYKNLSANFFIIYRKHITVYALYTLYVMLWLFVVVVVKFLVMA